MHSLRVDFWISGARRDKRLLNKAVEGVYEHSGNRVGKTKRHTQSFTDPLIATDSRQPLKTERVSVGRQALKCSHHVPPRKETEYPQKAERSCVHPNGTDPEPFSPCTQEWVWGKEKKGPKHESPRQRKSAVSHRI